MIGRIIVSGLDVLTKEGDISPCKKVTGGAALVMAIFVVKESVRGSVFPLSRKG